MKTIHLFFTTIFLITALVIYSCQKEITVSENFPAELKVYLTDHDTPVFDSVFIDIQKLEVKLEDDTLSNDGWFELAIRPGIYNILRFRNGIDTLFATGILPNSRIRKLRLTLGTGNSVMKDGQSFPLKVKDNEMEIIANMDDSNFEIPAPGQVLFWIDFDAGRSVRVDNSGPGNNNGYELEAHIKIFSRTRSGSIEGKVLPGDADPVVLAISSGDTAIAIPDDDGEFKIVGLNAGVYNVLFDGNNGYRDTTIQNIIVRNNEETRLAAIMLQR